MQQLQLSDRMQKPEEYELFSEWYRYKRLENLGVVDPNDMKDVTLLQIETQKEFSEKFDVTQHQLSRWKKRPEFVDYIKASVNQFLSELKGDKIKQAFLDRVEKDPSAANFKTYMQIFEGHKDGTDHNHIITPGAKEEKPDWILTSGSKEE